MSRHILGIARTLPFHSIGGMQAIAWDLIREFARLGHSVTVITTAIPGRAAPFVVDGVRVVPLEGTRPERCDWRWWRASARWLESGGAGSVDGVLSVSSAGAAIAARRHLLPGAKFVFQAHGTSWGEFISKWRTGRPVQWVKSIRNLYWLFRDPSIYRSFDCVAVVSDVLMKEFEAPPISWLTKNTMKEVVRNGVNGNIFRPDENCRARVRAEFGLSATDKVVVFAARLHPQKGGEVALRAFRRLAEHLPNARLLIAGDGDDLERLKALSTNLGLNGQVRFLGAVVREALAAILAAGDAFVFPTMRREGLTMNVLEALSTGLRPVCSSTTRAGFTSSLPILYAEPNNIPQVCDALREALDAGCSSVSLLSPQYSLDFCAKQYLERLLPMGG